MRLPRAICARMPFRDHLLALLAVAIWGTNFVLIRIGLDELSPMLFVGLRFFFCAIPLVFFLPRPAVAYRLVAAYGLLIGCGQFGLLFWAMQSDISPGLASLVVQLQVFFTILLAAFLFGEPVRWLQRAALLLCFAGLFAIIVFTDGSATHRGVMLVLAAALFWALGNVLIKRIGALDIVAFLAWSSLAAAPPLLVAALWLDGWTPTIAALSSISWTTASIVAWQAIGNTLIGYGIWNRLLERHPAAAVTPWALMVPVFGMSASWLILDESLLWWKLLAAALVTSGLAVNFVALDQPRKLKSSPSYRSD